jgi:hypothetical protein
MMLDHELFAIESEHRVRADGPARRLAKDAAPNRLALRSGRPQAWPDSEIRAPASAPAPMTQALLIR